MLHPPKTPGLGVHLTKIKLIFFITYLKKKYKYLFNMERRWYAVEITKISFMNSFREVFDLSRHPNQTSLCVDTLLSTF